MQRSKKRFNTTLLFCAVFIFVIFDFEGICASPAYRQLLRDLFDDYDPLVRPVYDINTTIDVDMSFYVAQVLDMSERKQFLKVNVWVTLIWKDEYLHWNSSEYGNVTTIKLPAYKVWTPQVVLYQNADDQYRDFMSKEIVKVSSTGDVMWAAPVIFISHCMINVYYFPFDEQECDLKFGPWQYDGTEVSLDGGGDVSVYQSNGEWDMLDLKAKGNVEYYVDDPGVPYTDVTYTLHLKRRPIFYVFNLLMPCGLLCTVTVVNFILPTESGEKVSLAITILLSLTVFLLLFAESMPPSDVIPIIGQFYAGALFLVSMSLLASVIVSQYHFSGPERGWLSGKVQRFIFNRLGPLVGLKCPNEKTENGDTPIGRHRPPSRARSRLWCSNSREAWLETDSIEDKTDNCNDNLDFYQTRRNDKDRYRKMNEKTIAAISRLQYEMDKLTSYYDMKLQEEYLKKDWRLFAVILDRIFLIIYLVGLLVTLLILICQL
ncbi:neuronal acetylcholine receptor subunit alpha-10-like [Glandiceps talaboti]